MAPFSRWSISMERRKAMKQKQPARRKMSRRVNKKHRAKRDGQNRDGAVRRNRKSIRAATKMAKGTPGTVRKNGAPFRSRRVPAFRNRKSTRLNSSHVEISYAVFCLKKKKKKQ